MGRIDKAVSVPTPISCWRIYLATTLDFWTVFPLFGFAIASVGGGNIGYGFKLSGWPALVLIPALVLLAAIIAYFWIGEKHLGGTLWQRILKPR